MELFWWFITIVLFAVGLIGTIAPVLPGTTIILAAAVIHRIMLGPEKSVGWKTIVVLVLLTLLSYVFDFLGSYFGAKYFGATRWGAFGAIVGALIGVFFGIIGLFVGPDFPPGRAGAVLTSRNIGKTVLSVIFAQSEVSFFFG